MAAALFNNLAVASFATAALVPLMAAQNPPHDLGYLKTMPYGILLVLCFSGIAQGILGQLRDN
jgi:hypothetical protein